MGIDLPNGPMNNSQSFSSNHYPSGQSRKVSIGIMVDKAPKMGSGARKEADVALYPRERASSFQEKSVDEDRGLGPIASSKGKQAGGKDQKASAWVCTTRSVLHATPATSTVHIFANCASVLQSDEGVHKKLDTVNYEKRREKGGNLERVEEVAFSTLQEMHVIDQGRSGEKTEETANGKTIALKMRLWEILGTAPAHNKQVNTSSTPLEENSRTPKKEQNKEHKKCEIAKSKQSSDTIEMDSSPNQTERRPVTRSRTRKNVPKKSPPKLQQGFSNGRKPLSSFSLGSKQNFVEKNIFTFDEGEGRDRDSKLHINVHLPTSTRKKSGKNSSRIEPRRISFPSRSVSEKSLETREKEPSQPSDNAAAQRNEVGGIKFSPSQAKEKNRQPKKIFSEKENLSPKTNSKENFSNPPLAKNSVAKDITDDLPLENDVGSIECSKSPPLSKHADPHEDIDTPPTAGNTTPLGDFKSPTLAVNLTPASQEEKLTKKGLHSPILSEKAIPAKSFYSLERFMNLREGFSGSDMESSDGIPVEITRNSPTAVKEKHEEKQFSLSEMEDSDAKSLGADELSNKGADLRGTKKWFSNAGSPKKSPLMLRPRKRLRSLEINISKLNPPSPSSFGVEENNDSHEASEQLPENSLGRAIAQLASILDRFRANIKSHTNKKSSEILSCVRDRICSQLQEVESQIQADVLKFTNLGKSKRKRLELRFQEQQDGLKAIHQKFEEAVNQHLLDCKRTIEELEAYQMGLKGNMERQKASHRRLISKVEEEMEVHLSNAETSITAIHQVARKKMNSLKHALGEWLEEEM